MEILRRNRVFVAVALAAVALFTSLGIWQLRRLEDRRADNARREARLERPPVALTGHGTADPSVDTPGPDSLAWRRVELRGRFDYAHEVALAPRSFDGTPAVYVLTPLVPGRPGPAVLVLRGAVPAPDGFHAPLEKARPPCADGSPACGPVTVRGVALPPPGGEGGRRPDTLRVDGRGHPVLPRLALARVEALLPYPVAGVYVQALETTEAIPAADGIRLPRRLPPPRLDDGPHLEYALQWFAFGLITLLGGGAYLWTRRTA